MMILTKTDIKKIIKKYPKVFSKVIKSSDFDFFEKINSGSHKTFSENLYVWLYGKYGCIICNGQTKFKGIHRGYKRFCSAKCSASFPKTIEKRKRTSIERYGFENPFQNSEIKEKQKKTLLKKYGVKNSGQTERARSKHRDYLNDKEKVQNMVKKCKETNLMRYEVKNPSQRHISKESLKYLEDISKLKDLYNEIKSCEEIAKRLSVGATTIQNRLRDEDIFVRRGGHSYPQLEIKKFIEDIIDSEILYNTRKIIPPKEIDIFIPNLNIAIEFCGLYWHAESNVGKFYHYNKYEICKQKGIQLITIFGDEWFKKKELCKDRLISILQTQKFNYDIRKIKIKKIGSRKSINFLNQYHLQGSTDASIRYGAFFNNEMISCMTFSRDKPGHYELDRFTSKGIIPDVSLKLFRKFVLDYKPKSVITCCDKRWDIGRVYENLGFEKVSSLEPECWYLVEKYTKRIKNNKNKTEDQSLKKLNYDKIWDCGYIKFEWRDDEN